MKADPNESLHLNTLGLPPGAERDAGWYLLMNLAQLQYYTTALEHAVRLADHAESLLVQLEADLSVAINAAAGGDYSALQTMHRLHAQLAIYRSWMAIAARDAAMTIDHFEHLRRRICEGATKISTIVSLVDWPELKRSGALFRTYFPNFEAMRDAVAHESERASSLQEVEKFSFSGYYAGPGVKLDGPGNMTMTVQAGRILQMTRKDKFVSISASDETLHQLAEVKEAVYGAFRPVAAALAGKDLGD